MIAGLLALLMLMMVRWPDLPTSRWLHRTFVSWPLEMIERIERRHVIFLLVGLIAIQGFAMVMRADMAVLAALDLATYFDVAITAWTVAAMTRVKGHWSVWADRFRIPLAAMRLRRAPRTRRARRSPMGMRQPANDDEPDAALRRAA